MTNKEAISIIKTIGEDYTPRTTFQEENEALDLAIKALEEVEEWQKLKLICANEGIVVYKVRGKEE